MVAASHAAVFVTSLTDSHCSRIRASLEGKIMVLKYSKYFSCSFSNGRLQQVALLL